MTCPSCGLKSCDRISCFQESSDEDVEYWNNIRRLSQQYRDEGLTEVRGDPLLRKDAA